MARLRPGVRLEQVQPAADLIVKRTTAAARPQLTAADLPRVALEPGSRGQTESRNSVREPLTTMALVIGIVLLVACANVANLMLARGRARVKELTVRVAIGAGRARVVRQLVTEGLLLAVGGGVLGLLLAKFVAAALLPALTGSASILDDAALYWRVGLFTMAAAMGCTLLFGVVPALRATDLHLASGLQEAARANTSGPSAQPAGRRARDPAGRLVDAAGDGGGAAGHLAARARADRPWLRSRERARVPARSAPERLRRAARALLMENALARLRAIPGVRAASFSSHGLISGTVRRDRGTAGRNAVSGAGGPGSQQFIAEHRAWRLVVDEEFLATVGIRLRSGRHLRTSDTEGAPPVAVINESLAKQLFGTTDVVGRRFAVALGPKSPVHRDRRRAAPTRSTRRCGGRRRRRSM